MDVRDKLVRAEAFFEAISTVASKWSIPEGHSLVIDRLYETTWAMGYPSRSVSVWVKRSQPDPNDPEQVHVEVRYFLDDHRVTIFAEAGARWFGKFRPLLTHPRDVHLKAATLQGLMFLVSSSVDRALRAAQITDVREVA